MTPERWQHVTQLYEAALERDPGVREEFLLDACGRDAALRREVDSLLAHEATPAVVDSPIWELVGGLLDVEARLSVGTSIGHYRIDAVLGAGGMGQVYRARDTHLHRDVALKVLPDVLASDDDLLRRFRQEARVLACLNHPGIAAIYGLEELGHVRALVLELVDGPTLADRLQRGPIPIDESVAIAEQIAVALVAAHQQGIIHRDLKPANIKVTEDGAVKLLDFGLAKPILAPAAFVTDVRDGSGGAAPENQESTAIGAVLGTPAYMSPEQVKGRALDTRSDIWALGCVLYEMLTGRRAFAGTDGTTTLAAVVRDEPDWTALPRDLPERIRTLLARCLTKDKRHRVADAAVVAYVLGETATGPPGANRAISPSSARRSRVMAGAAMLAAIVVALGSWIWRSPPSTRQVTRLTLPMAESDPLALHGLNRDIAISPNGDVVAYRAGTATEWRLTVQSLAKVDPQPLPGTTRGNAPFFSPDGQWIGFSSGARLRKIRLTGGDATELCQIVGASLHGASWGPDQSIYFGDSDPSVGLLRVPASGGAPTHLTTPDRDEGERDHWFPHALPNGRGVLFTIAGERPEGARIAVLDLGSGEHHVLVSGSDARYLDTGHIVYVAAGRLRAVRFDAAALRVTGDPVPLPDQVLTLAKGVGNFDISRTGTLLHVVSSGGIRPWPARSLVWVDRQGREEPITVEPRAYASPRISVDGTRVALEIREGEPSVWLFDLRRKLLERLNSDPYVERNPVWLVDDQLLVTSDRSGVPNIYRHSVDGSGRVESITPSPQGQYAASVSQHNRRIFLTQLSPLADILMFDERTRRAELIVARANSPAISPDGQWLAYQTPFSASSTTPGQTEVFVQRFPNGQGTRQRISSDGGSRPAWSRSGAELFFFDRQNRLTAVRVRATGSAVTVETAATLLPAAYFVDAGPAPGRPYDVGTDGRFLMIKADATPASRTHIVVVQNWSEELKQLAPVR